MARFEEFQLLGIFEFDDLGNTGGGLMVGQELPALNLLPAGAFLTGPRAMEIYEVVMQAQDLTFTDPNVDVGVGMVIDHTPGGGSPSYTVVYSQTEPSGAALPLIWDDDPGDYGDFTLNTPLNFFALVGQGSVPLLIPADTLWRVRCGTFATGPSATDLDQVDDFFVYVFGKYL